MMDQKEIERLASLSDDALFIELGRAIHKHNEPGLQVRPPNIKKLIQIARDLLNKENERIRQAVCTNEVIREIVTNEPSSKEKVIRVLADVIGALITYIPAGTVGEIIMRDGLPNYCKVIWKDNN